MTIPDIKEQLIDQIALSIGEESSTIQSEMQMHELGLDSLKLVELFIFVEKEFGVRLMAPGISQDDIKTIDAMAEYINTTKNEIG